MYAMMLFGLILIVVSSVMLLRPVYMLEKFRFLITGYTWRERLVESLLCLGFGSAFYLYGVRSAFPFTLQIVGYFLLAEGIIIAVTPLQWHRRFAWWALDLLADYLRMSTLVVIPFGAFIIYAVLMAD